MFTSRLPKSTSARRPSNPNDGSTSIFGSHIPVSVKKANLFTPQAKRSLQGPSSTSRKSYLNTDKKYQRPSKPQPDPDEQRRMFDNLVDFLKEKEPGFPLPDYKRFSSSVSTTECSRIFEFLISRVYPEFKINKLEIDVPEALALLNYPYLRTVTKSALVSITTRQAVVNLLVIFDWLVAYCRLLLDGRGDPFPPVLSCIIANPSDPIAEYESRLETQVTDDEPQMETLNALIEERNRLAEQWDDIQRLDAEIEAMTNDVQECDRYQAQITEYMANKNELKKTIQQKLLQNQDELSEARAQLEKVTPIVELEQPSCDSATLAHYKKKLEKAEEDLRAQRQSDPSQSNNIDLKRQELELKKIRGREQVDKLLSVLASKTKQLETAQVHHEEVIEGNTKRLKQHLEANRLEARSLVRRAEFDEKRFTEILRKVKENNRVVRSKSSKFKTRK